MDSGFSLKDQLFNEEKTRYLAGLFAPVAPGFDAGKFTDDVMSRLLDLELKERINWIAETLGAHLPQPLPELAPILTAALPAPLDPSLSDDDFGDFIFAPIGEFIVARGLDDHPELSLDLISEVTKRFSMEWAIRPFLNQWTDLTLARMAKWAEHENYHVRRLASEGTRPRLPWGMAVPLTLDAPLPILDVLHRDPTRYVTRSVANHLNDISKKQPELVLDRLKRWADLGQQDTKELKWITNHALRGLVKAGDPRALRLLGYDPDVALDVTLTLQADSVAIGDALTFDCQLSGEADAPVLVDYIMHFPTKGGKTRVKTHKLKQAALKNGTLSLKKSHHLKGGASTFTLVPGPHHIELMVNGVVRAKASFELTE